MGLEGHHRVILVPLRGGLVDKYVTCLSAAGLETELLTDAGDILRDSSQWWVGRGCWVKAWKCFQTNSGFRFLISSDIQM